MERTLRQSTQNNEIDMVEDLGDASLIDTKLSYENLAYLFETMEDEIESSIPLNQILSSVAKNSKKNNGIFFWRNANDARFAAIVAYLCSSLERGHTFAESVNAFPKGFSEEVRALILAAETSGRWVSDEERKGILRLIIEQLDKENKIKTRVKSAASYPIFILCCIGVAVGILVFAVLPKLREFFDALDLQKNLNFATKVMLAVGDFITAYYSTIPVVVLASIVGLVLFWYSYGKKLWAQYQFDFPLIGKTLKNIAVAQLFSLFSTLQSAGVTAEKSLIILAKTCTNKSLASSIEAARNRILAGAPFAETFGKCHTVFSDREFSVLESAEKAGTLDSRPSKHAEKLFDLAEREIDKLIGLVQPTMLVVVGLIVGFIVIGFYGAFFSAIGQLSSSQ